MKNITVILPTNWEMIKFFLMTEFLESSIVLFAEKVGKYMIRPLLSLKHFSFDETEGRLLY